MSYKNKIIKKNGHTLTFDEKKRRFTDEDGCTYNSVTKFINQFFPQFDAEAQAERMGKRDGVDPQVYLDQWKEKGKKASEHGDKVHEFCEKYIKTGIYEKHPDKKTDKCIQHAKACIDGYQFKIISCEKPIFSYDLKLMGVVDLIGRLNGLLVVDDWKTNGKIRDRGFNGEMGFQPFDILPNSEIGKYTLQLNTYLYIMRRENYYPWHTDSLIRIFHITENGTWTIPLLNVQKQLEEVLGKV